MPIFKLDKSTASALCREGRDSNPLIPLSLPEMPLRKLQGPVEHYMKTAAMGGPVQSYLMTGHHKALQSCALPGIILPIL